MALRFNLGACGKKPVTGLLSYDMVFQHYLN